MPFTLGTGLETLRENIYLRILRGIQFVLAVVILGISASNASDWHDLFCGTPGKLAYNIAASVITILVVLYLLAGTGKQRLSFLPWHHFLQLGLDVFLLIIWIASTATASLSCSDICNACSSAGAALDDGCGYYVWYGDLTCNCYFAGDTGFCPSDKHKRMVLDARNVFEKRARYSAGAAGYRGLKNGSKLGVNVVELILFVVSVAATVYFIFRARQQSASGGVQHTTTAPVAQVTEEPKMEQTQPAATYPPQQPGQPTSYAPQPTGYEQQQPASYPQQNTYYEHQQQGQPVNYATQPTYYEQQQQAQPSGYQVAAESHQPVSPINSETGTHNHSQYTQQSNQGQHTTTYTQSSSNGPPSYNTNPSTEYHNVTTYQ